MSKYIDREQASEALCAECKECFPECQYNWDCPFQRALIHSPSADVVERGYPNHGYMWICPRCGLDVHSDYEDCPKCGLIRPMKVQLLSGGEWIPIKWHNITEEEREREGYPKEWLTYLDCEMPQDGQEILVTTRNGNIAFDVCYNDDGFSLDSGWDWIDDILAWMPLPPAYQPKERSE